MALSMTSSRGHRFAKDGNKSDMTYFKDDHGVIGGFGALKFTPLSNLHNIMYMYGRSVEPGSFNPSFGNQLKHAPVWLYTLIES